MYLNKLDHELYMQRAIFLAQKGIRNAFPNPSVGAVIVYNHQIIGEGFTSAYGGAHAEVNAIQSVKDKSLLSKATLYVTLEPCAHYGKTPPCVNLIMYHQIPEVYIGVVDTNSLVSGKGIAILANAGCNVHVGCMENECLELHKRFFSYHGLQRPHVILKWAASKDNFIDIDRSVANINDAKPTWITNELSRQLVHQLRAKEHAILVGTNTVLKDNPSLTVRSTGGEHPIRVVIDKDLKIDSSFHIMDQLVKTIVFTDKEKSNISNIYFEKIDFTTNIVPQILQVLYSVYKIQSLIVEGGMYTLQSFIDLQLWDEVYLFTGDVYFKQGVKAPMFNGNEIASQIVKGDEFKIFKRL